MVVSPKEIPKVVGLRNEIGPAHAPPTTSQAARWARPTTISAPPTAAADRCEGRAWRQ
jgi:hypothetical protein